MNEFIADVCSVDIRERHAEAGLHHAVQLLDIRDEDG